MGLGMQLVAWPELLCEGLAARGFRVVRFDNRDAGLSTRMPSAGSLATTAMLARAFLGLRVRPPYTLDDMARDTVGLVRVFLADGRAYEEAEAKHRETTDGAHCRSLRLFRNKLLAHNDTRGAEQSARYGHEVALLEDTIWIATRLSIALPSGPPHCDPAKMVWDYEADRFWTALIKGAGPTTTKTSVERGR